MSPNPTVDIVVIDQYLCVANSRTTSPVITVKKAPDDNTHIADRYCLLNVHSLASVLSEPKGS